MKSWLWPDHNIGKRESRELRQEHNDLVNAHSDLLDIMQNLLYWVTHGDTSVNPYCVPEVKTALQSLTKERGMAPDKWRDAADTQII